MNRRATVGDEASPSAFCHRSSECAGVTRKELLVVIVVLGVLIALLLPALQVAREAARRMHCAGDVQRIGLAIHNYVCANKVFPPGTTCATAPIAPSNQYDV